MNALVLLLSVSSAPAFGVAAALKHAGATDMPHLQHLTVAGIGRPATATLHHRLRWAGSAVDVIAVSLHILALKLGGAGGRSTCPGDGPAVRARQPLGGPGGVPPRQLTWAIDLTGALAGFLAIAGTSAPAAGADVDTAPAVAAGIVGMARDGYAGIRAKDLLRSDRQACEWNKTMFSVSHRWSTTSAHHAQRSLAHRRREPKNPAVEAAGRLAQEMS